MKMLRAISVAALAALIVVFSTGVAKATITLTTATATQVFGTPPASNPSEATIAGAIGISVSELGEVLYGFKPATSAPFPEKGSMTADYTGVYDPPPAADTPAGKAIITWDGPRVADATALLVKDGKWGHWVWDIRGWDGMETIEIVNPYPDNGTISHIEFYGTPVPEPTTFLAGALLLLPFGVSALRVLRKKA